MLGRGDTKFLDLYRGMAALWVALAHCAIWNGAYLPEALEPKMAVDLFMVISGFLMAYTVRNQDEMRWKTWRAFYIRRYFRIAPAYYVAFAAILLLSGPFFEGMRGLMSLSPERWAGSTLSGHATAVDASNIGLHLSFLFGLVPAYASSSGLPDWSLSLEMQFYAAFPLICLAWRRFGALAILVPMALACFVLVHFLHGFLAHYSEPSLLVMKLPVFAVGILAYEAGRTGKWPLLAAAVLVLLLACRGYGASALPLIGIVVSLISLWFWGTPAWLQRLFHNRGTDFLSEASYSVYLVHGMAIMILGWPIMRWLGPQSLILARGVMTFAVIAAAYGAAWLMFRCVELPGITLGKWFSGSKAAPNPSLAQAGGDRSG